MKAKTFNMLTIMTCILTFYHQFKMARYVVQRSYKDRVQPSIKRAEPN